MVREINKVGLWGEQWLLMAGLEIREDSGGAECWGTGI